MLPCTYIACIVVIWYYYYDFESSEVLWRPWETESCATVRCIAISVLTRGWGMRDGNVWSRYHQSLWGWTLEIGPLYQALFIAKATRCSRCLYSKNERSSRRNWSVLFPGRQIASSSLLFVLPIFSIFSEIWENDFHLYKALNMKGKRQRTGLESPDGE
jgi:hypothetical protein